MRCWLTVLPFLVGCVVPELSVERRGEGAGVVTSDPAGIECGKTCGTPLRGRVSLAATPAPGSLFVGWGGACSGGDACEVNVDDEDVAVVAEFATTDRTLSIVPSEGGTVVSEPEGIVCGDQCVATFRYGTRVRITAQAAAGFSLVGWDAPECMDDQCVIDLVEPRTYTPTFRPDQRLSVATVGAGQVVSTPSGISSSHPWANFPFGAVVDLYASPDPGSTFVEWSGECAGITARHCLITMDRARAVKATFEPLSMPSIPPTDRPCTVAVTASESAAAFNVRLVTNAVVCVDHGVAITGNVVIAANDVVIRGVGGTPLPALSATSGDAVHVEGVSGALLQNVDISATGSSAIGLAAKTADVALYDSYVRCEQAGCYLVHADNARADIRGSSLFGALMTQQPSNGVLATGGAAISVATTVVESYGVALEASSNSSVVANGCIVRGDGNVNPLVVVGSKGRMSLTMMDVSVAGPYAVDLVSATEANLELGGDTFRKIAGTASLQSSPIYSGDATNAVYALSPSGFCNEGTSTTDGAWVAPLLGGMVAPASTFDSAANTGPGNCAP